MLKTVKVRVEKAWQSTRTDKRRGKSESLASGFDKRRKVREIWASKNAENREFLQNLEKIEQNCVSRREIFPIG